MRKYLHVVMFRIHDNVEESKYQAAIEQLKQLGRGFQGLEVWNIIPSLDVRKGRVVMQESLFTLRENFHAFRESDAHRKVTETMTKISDWWVCDAEK